jgi:DNA-directed RNA polymerase subunit RPC12/RpoP
MILGIKMATINQKERYRQRAALCYEIAATLSGDTATSMRRLGNSYSELAEDSDRPRTGIFVPTKRHEVPHCATCGNEMRFTYSLRRTETLQAMQAFHCNRCRETVIWKER